MRPPCGGLFLNEKFFCRLAAAFFLTKITVNFVVNYRQFPF